MKRAECYEALFRLKTEKKIDIEAQLQELASSAKVPKGVIKFIEEHSVRTLDDFINIISRTKPFFQNLCFNYEDDISIYIKALLSMLTHLKITIDKNPELRTRVNELFDIEKIITVIKENLVSGDNDEEVIALAKELKLIFLAEENE